MGKEIKKGIKVIINLSSKSDVSAKMTPCPGISYRETYWTLTGAFGCKLAISYFCIELFRQRLSQKGVKAYTILPKDSLGNTQKILRNMLKAQNPFNFFSHANKYSYCSTAFHCAKHSLTWRYNSEQPQPIMPFGIVANALMVFSWTTFLETAVQIAPC